MGNDQSDDYALVRCGRCGELVKVAWELLGDLDSRDEETLCGECELDELRESFWRIEDDWLFDGEGE